MADTARTQAELLTLLFQDGQAAGSISEQDMRDLIVSMTPAHGSVGMEANATPTTIGVAGTFTKVLGTTTLGPDSSMFDMPASNRLRFNGVSPRHLHIAISFDMITGGTNQVTAWKVWHWDDSAGSGVYLTNSLLRRKVGTGADVGAVALHADVIAEENDYIELHCTNETSTSAITVGDLYMFAMGIFQ